ncbi:MAG: hypothetical protein EA399_14200 [Desulfovibrionales bacterium]|nr:MAG: hypothetical protein EA399_14200 [Desulfovibrionales bacterium]
MKSLTIIFILAGMALALSSCCPLRATCTPVVVMQGVPAAAMPVLPTYGVQRCQPAYLNACVPYHLPYVTKPRAVPPLAAPPPSCCFPW